MSSSARLRAQDWREIIRLVGECRELGDDPGRWRGHLLGRVARLVDCDTGFSGEMAGISTDAPADLGYAHWGHDDGGFDRSAQLEVHDLIASDPSIYTAINAYFLRATREDGVPLSRRGVIDDGAWYASDGYQLIHRGRGVDHVLWCFRTLPGRPGGPHSGLIVERARGRRDFSARQISMVGEVQAALGPLIRGPLARFTEPTSSGLAPRVRQVLACLLEGDGDKQVAARLGLSRHTVNEYTKGIYRHFGVGGRAELLARWLRQGWSRASPDPDGRTGGKPLGDRPRDAASPPRGERRGGDRA